MSKHLEYREPLWSVKPETPEEAETIEWGYIELWSNGEWVFNTDETPSKEEIENSSFYKTNRHLFEPEPV